MSNIKGKAKTLLLTLVSFAIGTSVVAECSNGGKISWEPRNIVAVDSTIGK